VDDLDAGLAAGSNELVYRRKDRAKRCGIISLLGEVTRGGQEILLQVDHDKRRFAGIEIAVIGIVEWFCRDHEQAPLCRWDSTLNSLKKSI
jgi:hypothetical protein